MKNKLLGIASVVLASVSLFLLIETPHYPALGDLILKKIGLKAWTDGDTGLHLTFVYAMVLIFLAFAGIVTWLYGEFPKTRNKGKWLVLGLTVILVTAANKGVEFNKSIQPGLKAIQFLPDESRFKYNYKEGKLLSARGIIEFKNYSKTSRSFYIKYIPDDEFIDEFIDEFNIKEFVAHKVGEKTPELIEIAPRSTERIQVDFSQDISLKTKDKESSGAGTMSIEKLIIYNDQEQIEFTKDN